MEKNVIIYTRVSTAEQADKGYSLPYQKGSLEKFCELQGYNIVAHFEEDYSAKTFDRPKWNLLMDYVKSNRKGVDEILMVKWDRFSRHSENALAARRILNGHGVNVNTVEQPLDFSIPESKIMLALYLAVPEVENDKNSARTTVASRQARIEGCWTGSAPYGYSNFRNEAGKSTLTPNDKSNIVREAFEMFSTGLYSVSELRKKLTLKGFKLSKMSTFAMLRNVAYLGKILIKEWEKNDAFLADGLHAPIITDEQFNDVQNILKGRKKKEYKLVSRNEELPLRGFLKCKCCGGNLTGSKSKGSHASYFYYHCNNNRCKERFRADKANLDFLDYLQTFQFPEEVLMLYYEILKDVFKRSSQEQREKISGYENEVDKLNNSLKSVQDKYVNDLISQSEYESIRKRYNSTISEMLVKATELKAGIKDPLKHLKSSFNVLLHLSKFYSDADIEVKQKIIRSIFPEKLEYFNREYRTNRLNEVFSLIASMNKGLEIRANKKALKYQGLSSKAPPPRLERGTL